MPLRVAWTSGIALLTSTISSEPLGGLKCRARRSTRVRRTMLNVASGHDLPSMQAEERADALDDLGMVGVQEAIEVFAVGQQLDTDASTELCGQANEDSVRDPIRATALDAADRRLGQVAATASSACVQPRRRRRARIARPNRTGIHATQR